MYNLLIYYSKETLLTSVPGGNHTTKVIMTLMEPLANMSYDLYTDRFYTSPQVATELLQIKTTITGTVMTNKHNMPAAVKQKRRQNREGVTTY